MLTGRESMSLYMGGLQLNLISAYLYFLYTKRHPNLLKVLNGKALLLGTFLSAYAFAKSKPEFDSQSAVLQKISSHFSFNSFLGASVCNFLLNFLPQVNLGLVLPLCFTAAFFDSSIVMKTYRPGVEHTGSVIAWFYSNETTFVAASLYGALGVMTGLGLVMLTPSYKWLKGDSVQVISVAMTVLSINAFAVFTSMRVLERDFKYTPYNKWDASMTYVWRLIPMIYIPVDYHDMNSTMKKG